MIASNIDRSSLLTSNSPGSRSGSSTGSGSATIAAEKVLDRRRRIVSFAPGSVFAFVRWASNDFGTVISRIDIVRAVAPGEAFSTLPFVRPGGDILLRITGWPKVERVLQAIDAVEAAGIDPADAAPDHWRHVHNRLTAGEEPRPYTRDPAQRLASAAEGRSMTGGGCNARRDGAWRLRGGASARGRRVPAVHLERQRQRADRSLRRQARRVDSSSMIWSS